MLKYTRMMDERHEIERLMIKEQKDALNKIINELINYPIAMNDRHYEFLQKIQKELEDFRDEL